MLKAALKRPASSPVKGKTRRPNGFFFLEIQQETRKNFFALRAKIEEVQHANFRAVELYSQIYKLSPTHSVSCRSEVLMLTCALLVVKWPAGDARKRSIATKQEEEQHTTTAMKTKTTTRTTTKTATTTQDDDDGNYTRDDDFENYAADYDIRRRRTTA